MVQSQAKCGEHMYTTMDAGLPLGYKRVGEVNQL